MTIDARVLALLLALRGRDLQVAVVSNCAPEEVAAWPACALAPIADACIWSYACGDAKPEPAIYERALHRLGVAPGEAIFVGDGGQRRARRCAAARDGRLPGRVVRARTRAPRDR